MDSLKVLVASSLLLEGRSNPNESIEGILEGTARITHELATRLVSRGLEVVALTDCPRQNLTKGKRDYDFMTVGHRFSIQNLSRFRKLVREIRPDVVHFHGGELMSYYARLVGLRSSAKSVMTFTFIPSLYRRASHFPLRAVMRGLSTLPKLKSSMTMGFDHVLTLTSTAAHLLGSTHQIPFRKLSVIRYGLSAEYLDWKPSNEDDKNLNIACLSGAAKERGFGTFISAIPMIKSQAPDASFTLAIRSKNERKTCNDRAPLGTTVSGPAPLYESLQSSSIVALPFSRHVAVDPPLSLLECMAMGKNVISTPVGSIPEVIGPNRGLIVPRHDPSALARGILQVLGSDSLRKSISRNAREYMKTKYSWRVSINSIIDIYRGKASSTSVCETLNSEEGRPNSPSGELERSGEHDAPLLQEVGPDPYAIAL